MIEQKVLLVAMEMGLGKTVCTIAAVEHLIDNAKVAGGLLIMPSSLKYQWGDQIDQFTHGEARWLVVDGPLPRRQRAYDQIAAGEVEYAILNYEQVVNDWRYVKLLPRDYLVIDEATAVKNNAAKRTRALKRLPADYRWALTGQPVENRAEELFSIMEFVDPTVLGPADVFDRTFIVRNQFGDVERYINLPVLHKAVKGSMVRFTRSEPEIAAQMPSTVEKTISVPFDSAGAKLYRRIAADLKLALADIQSKSSFDLRAHYLGTDRTDPKLGAAMARNMALRMACDHPDLITRSASLFASGSAGPEGSEYAWDLVDSGALPKNPTSPKLKALLETVEEILVENPKNKVVVFSFFKGMLSLIQEGVSKLNGYAKTSSVLFTGDMDNQERQVAKRIFQTDAGCRVFLSSDAGGYGVDLPQANYLISYDLPASAGALAQRNARIMRLSSEFKSVTLISLQMRGSIEERQYAALKQKQSIADSIVDGTGHDSEGALDLTLESLARFLALSTV